MLTHDKALDFVNHGDSNGHTPLFLAVCAQRKWSLNLFRPLFSRMVVNIDTICHVYFLLESNYDKLYLLIKEQCLSVPLLKPILDIVFLYISFRFAKLN